MPWSRASRRTSRLRRSPARRLRKAQPGLKSGQTRPSAGSSPHPPHAVTIATPSVTRPRPRRTHYLLGALCLPPEPERYLPRRSAREFGPRVPCRQGRDRIRRALPAHGPNQGLGGYSNRREAPAGRPCPGRALRSGGTRPSEDRLREGRLFERPQGALPALRGESRAGVSLAPKQEIFDVLGYV